MYPTIIEFKSIIIRSYALSLAVAFLAGTLLAIKRAKKYGIQPHEMITFANVIILASLAGSRLLYVLENLKDYLIDPLKIFYFWQGGFNYHGGLFLSFLVALWWLNKRKISFGCLIDIVTPSMALGFFFVRIGCFLNGCCFGNPTDMVWGVMFPPDSPAGWEYRGVKIHPTQLYSSISGIISFFVLIALEKKLYFVGKDGLLFCSFLILSATWRFIIEYYRYNDVHSQVLPWFTNDQGFCMVIFFFSIFLCNWICKGKRSLFSSGYRGQDCC